MIANLTGLFLSVLAASAVLPSVIADAKSAKLETTDTMIPSGEPGVELFVRNKHPAGKQAFFRGQDCFVRSWRDLPGRNGLRSADRGHVHDGFNRIPRLRRLSGRRSWLWPFYQAG